MVIAGALLLYPIFISGLSTNPGGFYYDEACEAFHGYSIATTGTDLNGKTLPLFFQCYTGDLTQWMSPLYIYVLAAMYLFVPPSALSAHILSATFVFIAAILLGILAARISGRDIIGIILALTALTTPWLFEISRLAHEPSLLCLGIVLFFYCLYNAHTRETWSLSDKVLIALSLAMMTYTYAGGRVLGAGFAFGLLIFVGSKKALWQVLKTWAIYVVLLIPFIIAYVDNRDAITARFREVSYITPDTSWWMAVQEFVPAFLQDISPTFLLLTGDRLLRHHIPGMGGILAVTSLLAIAGLVIVLLRHRDDAWWRFILFSFVVSILPGALTVNRQHFLRLVALPIILLVLTIPALSTLVRDTASEGVRSVRGRLPGMIILGFLLILTAAQAVYFQMQFRRWEPERIVDFHKQYPEVLAKALEQPLRPIYLKDGRYGPAYILALWYATVDGIDPGSFVHLQKDEIAPPDSLVLSSDNTCTDCKVIMQKSVYLLYRTTDAANRADLANAVIVGSQGNKPGEFMRPRGVAADSSGNFYVADTGNHRVQRFDAGGTYVSSFGETEVSKLNSPNGIAVDDKENVYVTDAGTNKLLRFGSDGEYQKEWTTPEIEFYGPRDIAIAPNGSLYIVDQGRSRIVKFDPATETFEPFGLPGSDEGQFREPSGIAVNDRLVFVADAGNKRIQVFDLDGNYVRQWPVDVWEEGIDSYPDCVFDKRLNRLYVTSEQTKDVIAFDLNGNRVDDEHLTGNTKLVKPAALFLSETRTLFVLDITDSKIAMIKLPPAN